MNEFERLFEIIGAVGAVCGVIRQSLAEALSTSTSMTGVQAVGDDTHEFLAGLRRARAQPASDDER